MLKNKFKPVGTIYETTDYDAFTLLDFNRDAKPRKDLLDALDENGRFYEHIIVNENLEVLDGQHRLLSAKLKKKPITFYIVDKNTAEQVIRSVNTERRNWSVREYIDFYAKLGNKNFQVLISYLDSPITNRLADSTVHDVLAGRDGQSNKIKGGTYKVGNLRQADKVLSFMDEVMENHKGKMGVRVAKPILILLKNKRIDTVRLHGVLSDEEVYNQAKTINGEGKAVDYIMSVYNKGLTTNYIEYYFDKRGAFQTI